MRSVIARLKAPLTACCPTIVMSPSRTYPTNTRTGGGTVRCVFNWFINWVIINPTSVVDIIITRGGNDRYCASVLIVREIILYIVYN